MKGTEVTEPQVLGRQGLARWYGISEPMADRLIADDVVPNIKLSDRIVLIPVRALEAFEDELGRITANNNTERHVKK